MSSHEIKYNFIEIFQTDCFNNVLSYYCTKLITSLCCMFNTLLDLLLFFYNNIVNYTCISCVCMLHGIYLFYNFKDIKNYLLCRPN